MEHVGRDIALRCPDGPAVRPDRSSAGSDLMVDSCELMVDRGTMEPRRWLLATNEVLARKPAELERLLEDHSLSASTGERVRVRCRFGIRPLRRHPRTRSPACQTATGNRLPRQGRQRALPRENELPRLFAK
jgi:hypothetical protein